MEEDFIKGSKPISKLNNKGKAFVQRVYDEQKAIFSQEFGIPENQFPKLVFSKKKVMDYNMVKNRIAVNREMGVGDVTESMGEELAHFVRAKKVGNLGHYINTKELHSEEFLGFVGRKIAYLGLPEEKRKKLFPNGEPSFDRVYDSLGKVLNERGSSFIRNKYRVLLKTVGEARKGGNEKLAEQLSDVARAMGFEEDVDVRNRMLIHYRPYKYASKLDLSKVKLPELFEMSDKELRYRYFRADPIYGMPERREQTSTKRQGLEKIAATAAIFFVSFSLLFFMGNFTGFVVSDASNTGGSYIVLIVACLIAGFFYFWRSRKAHKL
ncbi:MAG: hypothetical protein WCK90_00055 [archaeon]